MTACRILTDHIPRKQGLRLRLTLKQTLRLTHRPYSTKTRIKTIHDTDKRQHFCRLTDHIPRKQGLRRIRFSICRLTFLVLTDHIPRKQGLRRIPLKSLAGFVLSHRPYSTKTRIKTLKQTLRLKLVRHSQTIFHENKD